MVDLKIDTAENALALLEQGWPTVAVSLVGDDLRFELPNFGPHHLILRFHDVEGAAVGDFRAPTEQQIGHALRHTAALNPDDRLLVHCHAGRSRSPAMAIGILIQQGLSAEAALEKVKSIRPHLIPNRLMIRHIDHVLGLDGELIILVDRHYQSLGPEAVLPDRGEL